jgi:hypothetical protein
MRSTLCILTVGISLICSTHRLSAADPASGVTPSLYSIRALTCPEALLRGCCGVYRPKPTPCIDGFCRGSGPYTYCGKPCPFAPCFRGGCGVTYCPKPCPDLCRPLASDFFICVQSSSGGTGRATGSNTSCSSPVWTDFVSPSGGTETPSVPRLPTLPH